MNIIPEAAAYNEAAAAWSEAKATRSNLELELALAKRGGNETEITAANEACAAHEKVWIAAYRGNKDSAGLLCRAVGVNIEELRWALA